MTILPYICDCIMGFVSSHLKAFRLQMVVHADRTSTTSFNLGSWIRNPQYAD